MGNHQTLHFKWTYNWISQRQHLMCWYHFNQITAFWQNLNFFGKKPKSNRRAIRLCLAEKLHGSIREVPESGDLNIWLRATIKPDELNYSHFHSDIHSALWISLGTDVQLPFRGDDKHPSVLMVPTGRLIRPWQDMSPSTVSPKPQLPATKCRLYDRALSAVLVVQWTAHQSGLFSVELPRRPAWASNFFFMQERVSLLIKCLRWSYGEGPAQAGVVPSPRCRSAGLLANPCGGRFANPRSLTPHAARAVTIYHQRCYN